MLDTIVTLLFLSSLFCAFSLCLPLSTSAQKRWIIAQIAASCLVTLDASTTIPWLQFLYILTLTIIHAEAFRATGSGRPFRIRHMNLGPALFLIWISGLWFLHRQVSYVSVAIIHFSLLHLCQLRAYRRHQVKNNTNHEEMQQHIRYLLASQHNARIEQQAAFEDVIDLKSPAAA